MGREDNEEHVGLMITQTLDSYVYPSCCSGWKSVEEADVADIDLRASAVTRNQSSQTLHGQNRETTE